MNIRFYLFSLYLFAATFSMQAQTYVTGFRLQQSGNTVKVEFAIPGGITCNGMNVLRSADSVNYEVAVSIAGVCGSTTDDVLYSFTDENPVLNSDNFYKIELKQVGYSSTLKIHVFDQSFNTSVFPNPANISAEVYFSPDYGRSADASVFSSDGKMLIQKLGVENSFSIDTEFLKTGVYYIQILTNQQKRLIAILIKE